jgi:F0F1-type ATP synthase delta subunit
MNYQQNILAIRYADAFLNVFDAHITLDNFQALSQAAVFFNAHKGRLALALTPYLNKNHVLVCIISLCKDIGVPDSCIPIIQLLARMNRLALLPAVLFQISEQYKIRHNIVTCSIISSHVLSERNKALLDRFLENSTKYTLMKKYDVDEKLIAGIRIVGDTLFWEYSIRRYLAEIGRTMIIC